MPTLEQLKAYLQNPGVGMNELASRYQGALADAGQAKTQGAQDQSDQLNKIMPGVTSPQQQLNSMNEGQSMQNIAGMSNVGRALASPASNIASSLENAPLTAAEDAGQRVGGMQDRQDLLKRYQQIISDNPTADIAAANKEAAIGAREAPGAVDRSKEATEVSTNPELFADMLKRNGVR